MFAGIKLDDFLDLPDAKQFRQQAKAINFGIPGGLGAAALVNYAKSTYGVILTPEQAADFRTKVMTEVYPELGLYLSEDTASVIAKALHADAVRVRVVWSEPYEFGMINKILKGNPARADGTPYKGSTVDRVWRQLDDLNQNPELVAAIADRDTSNSSPLRRLTYSAVSTLTGRVRGGVSFTAARNTPFQGLAADGCKLAMWNLLKAGHRVAAFVHDEFLIEIPRLDDWTAAAKDIERICCQAMQPLVGDIPVTCEYALMERWYKQAAAVFDSDGQLQIWQPDE